MFCSAKPFECAGRHWKEGGKTDTKKNNIIFEITHNHGNQQIYILRGMRPGGAEVEYNSHDFSLEHEVLHGSCDIFFMLQPLAHSTEYVFHFFLDYFNPGALLF